MNEVKSPKKPLLYYYLLVMLVLLLFNLLAMPWISEHQIKEVDYNTFVSMVEKKEIGKVDIQEQDNRILFTDPEEKSIYKTAMVPDDDLVSRLLKAGISTSGTEIQQTSLLVSILGWVLPLIIFIGLGQMLSRSLMKKMGGGNSMMFNMGKSNAKVYVKSAEGIKFDDVAGEDEAKENLQEVVNYLHDPSKYQDIGASMPKGILLVGPPGTGKTMLAKAVAGEANVPFFSMSGSEFVEMFVGMGASKVRDLFRQAKEKAPCIVFIDEIDAIGQKRNSGNLGGNDEREQTLNQLLTEMDGFEGNTGVIILAATNRPESLDPALTRPGRFDRRVPVELPDLKGREAILRVHAKGKPMASEVDLKVVAQTTAGFTGADLANLLNEAALLTARDGKKKIDMEEIQKALIKIGVGTEKKTRVISEKEKYITAYHEGGHAILFEVLSELDPVHSISIIPTGMAGGYTMPLPGEDRMYMTKMMMEQEIISLLGGRAAEELVIKDITTGASNDIERATSMARDMVTKYGMSELLGPIQFGGDNDEVFIGRDWGHARNYGEGVAATIDQEVNRIVTDAYREAKRLLQENMEMLHATAKLLVEKEKVTGDEFRSLFDQKVRNEVLGIANEAEQPTETAENREEN